MVKMSGLLELDVLYCVEQLDWFAKPEKLHWAGGEAEK